MDEDTQPGICDHLFHVLGRWLCRLMNCGLSHNILASPCGCARKKVASRAVPRELQRMNCMAQHRVLHRTLDHARLLVVPIIVLRYV